MDTKEMIIPEENGQDSHEMILTRKLFPKGAVIKDLGEGNYHVEANFEDHPVLSGGQKIELDLKNDTLSLLELSEDKKLGVSPYRRFIIKEFIVNDQKIDNRGITILLSGRRVSEKEDGTMVNETSNQLYLEEYEARVDYFAGTMLLKSFRTANVLGAYFHELGHFTRQFDDLSMSELYEACCYCYEFIDFTKTEKELFRKKIYDERQASIKALKYIISYKEIFDTKKISELETFYSLMLIKGINYRGAFSPSELVLITDLTQDWHY